MLFKEWRAAFVFSNKERNGLLVLSFLLLIVLAADFCLPLMFPSKIEEVIVSPLEIPKQTFVKKSEGTVESSAPVVMKPFNPNTVEAATLVKMGLPSKLAANWSKYLQKGGSFRKKEEVRKLYGMSDELYKEVEPFLQMTTVAAKKSSPSDTVKSNKSKKAGSGFVRKFEAIPYPVADKVKPKVELNSADSTLLESLPGIGPALASRIIRYRNLLGGYHAVTQLKEIYGMKEEYYAKAAACLTVDSTGIKSINLNFMSLTDLGRHPYIGFKQAKRVLKCRDISGKFSDISGLTPLFSADSLKKLLPYLNLAGGVQ